MDFWFWLGLVFMAYLFYGLCYGLWTAGMEARVAVPVPVRTDFVLAA